MYKVYTNFECPYLPWKLEFKVGTGIVVMPGKFYVVSISGLLPSVRVFRVKFVSGLDDSYVEVYLGCSRNLFLRKLSTRINLDATLASRFISLVARVAGLDREKVRIEREKAFGCFDSILLSRLSLLKCGFLLGD